MPGTSGAVLSAKNDKTLGQLRTTGCGADQKYTQHGLLRLGKQYRFYTVYVPRGEPRGASRGAPMRTYPPWPACPVGRNLPQGRWKRAGAHAVGC